VIDTDEVRRHGGGLQTCFALCDEVDRLRTALAAADAMADENESAARRITGQAGEARGGVPAQSSEAEVRRLRAALDEAFDLDQLPIPYVVNYLVDLWHDHDGYDPGDTTEVLDALLSAITSASAPAGGHVLDLPRVGEADRG
jgi:hypothetical protein